MKKIIFLLFFSALLLAKPGPKPTPPPAAAPSAPAVPAAKAPPAPSDDEDFVIKKPGEITFTSGLVIEGHVEKPQVMLILSKERIKTPPLAFNASMQRFILESVRPEMEESNAKGALPASLTP